MDGDGEPPAGTEQESPTPASGDVDKPRVNVEDKKEVPASSGTEQTAPVSGMEEGSDSSDSSIMASWNKIKQHTSFSSRLYESNDLSDVVRRKLRILSFLIAFIASCGAFQMWSFSEYLFALKVQFGYTQFQVDLMMSFNFLGFIAAFPAGIMIYRCGIRLTALLGFATVTVFYLLLWWASYSPAFYGDHPGLMGLYFVFAGSGCGTIYIVALTSTVRNFSANHRALVVSILASSYNLGPMFYSITYEAAFKQTTGPKGENRITEYFMFVGLSIGVSSFLALLTYGDYLPSNENSFHILLPTFLINSRSHSRENIPIKTTTEGEKNGQDDVVGLKEEKNETIKENRTGIEDESEQLIGNIIEDKDFFLVMQSANFHLIFWPSIILYGVKGMVMGNVLVYLEDFAAGGYASWIPYMALAVSVVHKICVGYFSDRFLYMFPRSWFLLLAAIFGLVGFILAMLALHTIYGIVSVILLWTLSAETVPALSPVILLDDHGMRTFSRNVGLLFMGGSFIVFLAQLWVSNTYSWAANVSMTEATCAGDACFVTTFITGLIFCIVAAFFIIVYIITNCRQRRNWTNYDAI